MSSGRSIAGGFSRLGRDRDDRLQDALRFRSLFEGATQAILRVDGEGRIRDANPLACELILDLDSVDDVRGKLLLETVSEANLDLIRGALESATAGSPSDVECDHVLDGRRRTCAVRMIPVPTSVEPPYEVLAIVEDTTEHTEIAEALRHSEASLRRVINLVPHFIFAKDAEGRFILVNRAVADAYGTTVERLLGKTDSDFNPNSEEVRHFRADDLRVIESGRPKFIPEEVITDANGKTRVLQTIKIPYIQADTDEPAVLGVAVDITDRKRAEEERDRLFNTSVDLLSIATFEGRFRQVNPAWTRLLGWSRDELLRFDWLDLVHPDDHGKTIDAGARLRRGRAVLTFENRYRCKDGSYKWLSWNAHPLPEMRLILSVTRDITDAKSAGEERLALERQLQHAQKLRSLGLLAGGIAHDFNNLLFGIMGNADLALLEIEDPNVRKPLEDIVRSTRRAAELCKQMLSYAGRGRLDSQLVDLSHEAREMARLLDSSISKKAYVVYELGEDLPAIEADPSQLRQVLMNLITNASDALGDRDGTIRVETGCRRFETSELASRYVDEPLEPGRYVFLRVSDTGCGMTDHVLEHLFDPFFTTKFTGRGLGLSAVLGILRAHRGLIRVRTQPGEGTTMEALFPAACAPAPVRDQSTVTDVPEWTGHGTILLVDDEDLVREMGQRLLMRLGFQVLVAKDGAEAVDLFTENHEHIVAVLLDMTMPRMDGREAMKRLHRIADVPVILMSGYEDPSSNGKRNGGPTPTAFVQKPFRARALVETLRGVLDTSED